MDLIGKTYIDYQINFDQCDGSTHELEKYSVGGVINIFKDDKLMKIIEDNFNYNIILFCNKENKNKLTTDISKLKVNVIEVESPLPSAFILEKNGERSSFIINDDLIEVNNYERKNNSACIYYGDKLISDNFKFYNKVYIDTAGNSKKDLHKLAMNRNFPRNSVVSISNEYLDKDLQDCFLDNTFTLVSHSPCITEIYNKDSKTSIKNKYYMKPSKINKNQKITGLGDKYTFLIAMYNYYGKLTLEKSVIKAQRVLASTME